MDNDPIALATAVLQRTRAVRPVGRISDIGEGLVRIDGLNDRAALGDIVTFTKDARAEIVRITEAAVYAIPEAPLQGLSCGAIVTLIGQTHFAPHDGWLGRVVDPDGVPLDGGPLLHGAKSAPLRRAPPAAYARRGLGARIRTGYALFDTMLPLVRGQRIGLFAGSGVGKSTLLGGFARQIDADVVVIGLVGERGREVREFVDHVLGPDGLARSVVVAATSDRAPQVRRRCALAATAVAEHFRDQGLHVLLMIDSVTRFAEAHREVALATGENAALRGFPPSTAAGIAGLCERSGPGEGGAGDITAIYSVLVAGSDMDEPVADMLRGVLDGHVVMDRAIAERGRYPAVDVLRSVSRSLPAAASDEENAAIKAVRHLMGTYAEAEMMVRAGLYSKGTDVEIDRAIAARNRIEEFCAAPSETIDEAFTALSAIGDSRL